MGLLRQFGQTPDMRPPMGGGMQQMQPPQMPQGAGGMMGAFSGNPQFQQQLEALMNMQGPGAQGQVGFQPPPMPVNGAATQGGGQQRRPFGGSLNTGSDPNTMRLLNQFAWPQQFNGG